MQIELWHIILFALVTASLHAWMEVEIEGPHGWAEKLPTKIYTGKFVRWVFGSHVTGYHLAMLLTVVSIAHLPAFFVRPWSWNAEFVVLGYSILHFALEDFLWFVLNPAFGIKKFSAQHVWWHRRWLLRVPLAYWLSFPLSIVLLTRGSA